MLITRRRKCRISTHSFWPSCYWWTQYHIVSNNRPSYHASNCSTSLYVLVITLCTWESTRHCHKFGVYYFLYYGLHISLASLLFSQLTACIDSEKLKWSKSKVYESIRNPYYTLSIRCHTAILQNMWTCWKQIYSIHLLGVVLKRWFI